MKNEKRVPMKNITINIPYVYDINIQKLIRKEIIPSRSEGVRSAIRELLEKDFGNLELLGYYEVVD